MKIFGHSRIKTPDKHRYVSLIEYALKNPEFTAEQACSEVGLSDKEFRFIARSIFSLNAVQDSQDFRSSQVHEWILQPEAYFSYLQYIEFTHSVEHANRAYWLAVLAIIVSVLGVGVSMWMST